MLILPPLSLYIHIPWCVQKCPYCDFNSHALKHDIPEQEYIDALLQDLDADLHFAQGRKLHSIFIGGGTPSLVSPESIGRLLAGVQQRLPFEDDIEITLEANPGTVEAGRFGGFQRAGVNRISIGVQSFQADKLERLGRIHDPAQARFAAQEAAGVGLNSFNIDLMHGLPEQRLEDALYDLEQALAQAPPHLSWYQLTIEPNTPFASRPPALPEDDTLADIYERGHALLLAHGYQQYEVSAYAKPGFEARHNLNYWRFGDYLGIGCGAHGKITLPLQGQILRTVKVKHPRGYLDSGRPYLDQHWHIETQDLSLEYFMNRLRLFEPIPCHEFTDLTGLPLAQLQAPLAEACRLELLENTGSHWRVTPLGRRFLNRLLDLFLEQ
ncbi:radical SAM family heme chaperone HemW [Oceanimonas sp. CAM02]|uniref:radical SAM family heme chaperone HemW n=1 Tax=Oceanimonas sp. CAM02 TaxID=3080336 RepID=UPI0029364A62|nr:radical SAM family heme chaperone HemW [Oceanimonas sp. CAM02]MDV2857333.1 radical SAM family heme chaperone HemW [Oceanimonas sp. CAM02]